MPADLTWLQQRPIHRGHANPQPDLLALHHVEDGRRIEARHQHQPESMEQPGIHQAGLRRGVEQRQRDERNFLFHAAANPRQVHVAAGDGVEQHVRVGELGALGVSGGARGVEDDRGVVHAPPVRLERRGIRREHGLRQSLHAFHRARRVWRQRHHQELLAPGFIAGGLRHRRERKLGGSFEGEQRLRVAVLQVVGDLARLQQHVERHDHRPGLENAVIGDREPRQVGTTERHVIARRDPHRRQRRGDTLRLLVQLAVGHRPPGAGEGDAIRHQPGRVVNNCREIQRSRVMGHRGRKLPRAACYVLRGNVLNVRRATCCVLRARAKCGGLTCRVPRATSDVPCNTAHVARQHVARSTSHVARLARSTVAP